MNVALSPCVGICRLDDATGYCLGCGRTGEEIAAWSTVGPGGRRAIWTALPARLQSLGGNIRRLPWTAAEVRGFVLRTLREGKGAWRMAAPGAAASFPCPSPVGCEIRSHGEVIEAVGTDASLRLRCGGGAYAFAIDRWTATSAADSIVLAVPANRPPPAGPPSGTGDTPHPDGDAICPFDRALPIRVVDADGQGAWWGIRHAEAAAAAPSGGAAPAEVLARDRADVVVIETALGRIEVPVALARLGAAAPPEPVLPNGFIFAAIFAPRL